MGKLRVGGEVERELELVFQDLEGLPGQVPDLTLLMPGRDGGAVLFVAVRRACGDEEEHRRFHAAPMNDGRRAALRS